MINRNLIALVLFAFSPGSHAMLQHDTPSQEGLSHEATSSDCAPATLSSDDLVPEQASRNSELTEAEADRMLLHAVVSDARVLFQRVVRKRGTATAARIAVSMIRRDRAVRSAVYNSTRRTLTVVLRSGFTGEVALMPFSGDRF